MSNDYKTENQTHDTFRMERSIISLNNINLLKEITNDHIAESILYYICYEHQYNIFGYGRLNPAEFAKRFGYNVKYLQQKHSNPYQTQISKTKEKPNDKRHRELPDNNKIVYANNLENALFTLSMLPLICETTVVNNDKLFVRKEQPVRVLKAFYIEIDKQTGKVTYSYEVDEDFRRNLATRYQVSNVNSLVNLRAGKYGPLYQHLLRLREAIFASGATSTTPDNTPQFAYLCTLAHINTNQDPKYIKRDLAAVLKKIVKSTELDFEVEWAKNAAGQKFIPIFHFFPGIGETLGPDNVYNKMLRKEERIEVACIEFAHNLYKSCPYNNYEYTENAEELFFKWLKTDTSDHIRNLEYILTKSIVNIGCNIPGDIKGRITDFLHLAKTQTPDKFKEWIRYILISDKYKLYPGNLTVE